MAEERVERRLAAILCADVVGYSRLMGADEEGTLAVLKSHRRELIDPLIDQHRGRIFKTTGDGMLIEFASVVDAVRCAVVVQRGMEDRNANLPEGERIRFRIGINLGDVMVDEGDMFGDGVNVAARIEALAAPGEICVSYSVREQVGEKLPIRFADLGEHGVKNIARPVRVYRVEKGAEPLRGCRGGTDRRSASALADRPSLAVMPFTNMSGDAEQEYFVDGIVEDIITGLSRIKWLHVVARNSTFAYKGRAVDLKQVGRELGVRYVLEGSMRKAGNRVRVTAQLIAAASGTHVWAERYDRALDDIFELQDEITLSVVGAIEPSLLPRRDRARQAQAPGQPRRLRSLPARLATYSRLYAERGGQGACRCFAEPLSLQPDYRRGACRGGCGAMRCATCAAVCRRRTRTACARAMRGRRSRRGADDAETLATAGFVIGLVAHDYDTAMNAIDRALLINGTSVFGPGAELGMQSSSATPGETAKAIEYAERALRLSPLDRPVSASPYIPGSASPIALPAIGKAASPACGKAIQANPRFSLPYFLQAAALSELGRIEEAKSAGPAGARTGARLYGLRLRSGPYRPSRDLGADRRRAAPARPAGIALPTSTRRAIMAETVTAAQLRDRLAFGRRDRDRRRARGGQLSRAAPADGVVPAACPGWS